MHKKRTHLLLWLKKQRRQHCLDEVALLVVKTYVLTVIPCNLVNVVPWRDFDDIHLVIEPNLFVLRIV